MIKSKSATKIVVLLLFSFNITAMEKKRSLALETAASVDQEFETFRSQVAARNLEKTVSMVSQTNNSLVISYFCDLVRARALDINAPCMYRQTPFLYIAAAGNGKVIRALLDETNCVDTAEQFKAGFRNLGEVFPGVEGLPLIDLAHLGELSKAAATLLWKI